MVYPHRITLLHEKTCDVCAQSSGSCVVGVNAHPYVGLQSCEDDSCLNTAKEWLKMSTKTNKELKAELGEWVYVERSNGRKESGWRIEGSAYQEKSTGPYWVRVKDKKRHNKCVTLETLRVWNQPQTPATLLPLSP